MATYLENLERWKRKGAADAKKGKPPSPPSPHYAEVISYYLKGYRGI